MSTSSMDPGGTNIPQPNMQNGGMQIPVNYQHQQHNQQKQQQSMLEQCFNGGTSFEPTGTSKQYEETRTNLQNLNYHAVTDVPDALKKMGFDPQKYLEWYNRKIADSQLANHYGIHPQSTTSGMMQQQFNHNNSGNVNGMSYEQILAQSTFPPQSGQQQQQQDNKPTKNGQDSSISMPVQSSIGNLFFTSPLPPLPTTTTTTTTVPPIPQKYMNPTSKFNDTIQPFPFDVTAKPWKLYENWHEHESVLDWSGITLQQIRNDSFKNEGLASGIPRLLVDDSEVEDCCNAFFAHYSGLDDSKENRQLFMSTLKCGIQNGRLTHSMNNFSTDLEIMSPVFEKRIPYQTGKHSKKVTAILHRSSELIPNCVEINPGIKKLWVENNYDEKMAVAALFNKTMCEHKLTRGNSPKYEGSHMLSPIHPLINFLKSSYYKDDKYLASTMGGTKREEYPMPYDEYDKQMSNAEAIHSTVPLMYQPVVYLRCIHPDIDSDLKSVHDVYSDNMNVNEDSLVRHKQKHGKAQCKLVVSRKFFPGVSLEMFKKKEK